MYHVKCAQHFSILRAVTGNYTPGNSHYHLIFQPIGTKQSQPNLSQPELSDAMIINQLHTCTD